MHKKGGGKYEEKYISWYDVEGSAADSRYLGASEIETPAHVVHVHAIDVRHADVPHHEQEDDVGHVPASYIFFCF